MKTNEDGVARRADIHRNIASRDRATPTNLAELKIKAFAAGNDAFRKLAFVAVTAHAEMECTL